MTRAQFIVASTRWMDDDTFRKHMNLRHQSDLGGLEELSEKIISWKFYQLWREFHYNIHHDGNSSKFDHQHSWD